MHLSKIFLREPNPAFALPVESVDLVHAPRGEQTRGQVSAFWLKALSVLALMLCFQVDAKLNGQEPSIEKVSQIQLLPGPLPMHAGRVMPLLFSGQLEPAAGAITAGELWSFFNKQGLTEVPLSCQKSSQDPGMQVAEKWLNLMRRPVRHCPAIS